MVRVGKEQGSAYTLVELLVSMLIMVILMFGMHALFLSTSQTVGTGNAVATIGRDIRAAQGVFAHDLHNAAPDCPYIIIRSTGIYAFTSKSDETGDLDYSASHTSARRDFDKASIDQDADNAEGNPAIAQEIIPRTATNRRRHRTDVLQFFTRGTFPRQTGNDGTFISSISSNEARIWYGHLKLSNKLPTPSWYDPGDADISATNANDNNRYAGQWILGRIATLLVEPDTSRQITDATLTPQAYVMRGTSADVNSLSPLAVNSNSTNPDGSTLSYLQWSRYDMAGTSIAGFRRLLQNFIAANGADGNWWDRMMCTTRYRGTAWASRPLTAEATALVSPVFLRGCSQFIVEFAGDFITQDALGQITVGRPDGQIDFIGGAGAGQPYRIRWYGYPRDTTGDGRVQGWLNSMTNNDLADVVPLRDVLSVPHNTTHTPPGDGLPDGGAAFEKSTIDFTQASYQTSSGNYACVTQSVNTLVSALRTTINETSEPVYLCAFGPGDHKPSLIRIVIVLDDPADRLPNGKSFEMTYEIPQAY